MRRPPGSFTPCFQTSPTPLPETLETSRTPERHLLAFAPSVTKAHTSSMGRLMTIDLCAPGMMSSSSPR